MKKRKLKLFQDLLSVSKEVTMYKNLRPGSTTTRFVIQRKPKKF